MPSHILVVDDEQAVCWSLEQAFQDEGFTVSTAATAEDAIARAREERIDAILLDVRLPGMDGLTALDQIRQAADSAPVIVMTAHGTLETAVEALQRGAFDYLTKPFDLEEAVEAVRRLLQAPRSADELPEPQSQARPGDAIVGRSPAMQELFKRIAMVAPHDSCVLITGESGTGKELVARAVHRFSNRAHGPFVPVNLAALTPSLVESELFGHVKGAYTGAAQTRQGLLSLAEGGSIFFDEIGDVAPAVQVKLLRVLEHGEILPVGSSQPVPVDVRILAATHQDLGRKVAEGTFRHDLFFRLNVFQLHIPPLRERKADILPLAEHFLRVLSPSSLPLPSRTVELLQSRPWWGNVRELRNALEHAVIVARGAPLLPEHFPPEGGVQSSADVRQWLRQAVTAFVKESLASGDQRVYEKLLEAVEPPMLQVLLDHTGGSRSEAAEILGLNRATVRKKLERYRLQDSV